MITIKKVSLVSVILLAGFVSFSSLAMAQGGSGRGGHDGRDNGNYRVSSHENRSNHNYQRNHNRKWVENNRPSGHPSYDNRHSRSCNKNVCDSMSSGYVGIIIGGLSLFFSE